MTSTCYHCRKDIPGNQSYFEAHGHKVCLACYRTAPQCSKCKFPINREKQKKGLEHLCEFCSSGVELETGNLCYFCSEDIGFSSSHYEGQDEFVCQKCYQLIKRRCFLCGFPVKAAPAAKDPICSFCESKQLQTAQIESAYSTLTAYLQKFSISLPEEKLNFLRMDWKIIAGMQTKEDLTGKINRINQMVSHVYPVLWMKERFYTIPGINLEWFLPYFTIQLVKKDLCLKYKLADLNGQSPFHLIARGWAHWIGWFTAKNLKYTEPELLLRRFENPDIAGDFTKLQAIAEYREIPDLIRYAQENLNTFSQKYL